MRNLFAIAAAAAMIAAPAFAQVSPAPSNSPPAPTKQPAAEAPMAADATFAKVDANADGKLSMAEVQMADKSVKKADYDKYDADKSTDLSKAEFAKWHAEMAAAHKGHAPG